MILRAWHPDDVVASAELWNELGPSKYAISPDLLKAKTFDHPSFAPEASFAVEQDGSLAGFIAIKSSPVPGLYAGADFPRVHINALAFTSPEAGAALMDSVKSAVSGRGAILFGQDSGHFFPGVPDEAHHLMTFLESHGFVREGEYPAHDLEHDLASYAPPRGSLDPLDQEGVRLVRCMPSDEAALEEFLLREFPGRWHYDTVIHKCRQQGEHGDVFALYVGDCVEGFAYTQSWETTKEPVAGCVWAKDLGEHWGGLGPIGVSQRVRGKKFGGAVLAGALDELRKAGVRRCIIDWTSLVDFYNKYGFHVNRRYWTYRHPGS